jgi:hypothetical protein
MSELGRVSVTAQAHYKPSLTFCASFGIILVMMSQLLILKYINDSKTQLTIAYMVRAEDTAQKDGESG